MQTEEGLVHFVAQFHNDPLEFVKWMFPWNEEGSLRNEAGPEDWQAKNLEEIGHHLCGGTTAPLYFAITSANLSVLRAFSEFGKSDFFDPQIFGDFFGTLKHRDFIGLLFQIQA